MQAGTLDVNNLRCLGVFPLHFNLEARNEQYRQMKNSGVMRLVRGLERDKGHTGLGWEPIRTWIEPQRQESYANILPHRRC